MPTKKSFFKDNWKVILFVTPLMFTGVAFAFEVTHSKYMTMDSHQKFELIQNRDRLIESIYFLRIDLEEPYNEIEAIRLRKKIHYKEGELKKLSVKN